LPRRCGSVNLSQAYGPPRLVTGITLHNVPYSFVWVWNLICIIKKHRVNKFDNRVLWIIFGRKKNEIIGDLRKLHDDELHNFYSLPSIIRMYQVKRDEMGRAYNTHGEKRNAYRILVGKPKEK
jgi:hypothetical protein